MLLFVELQMHYSLQYLIFLSFQRLSREQHRKDAFPLLLSCSDTMPAIVASTMTQLQGKLKRETMVE